VQLRVGHFASPHYVIASITIENECLHEIFSFQSLAMLWPPTCAADCELDLITTAKTAPSCWQAL
jgi:hypothetical protein